MNMHWQQSGTTWIAKASLPGRSPLSLVGQVCEDRETDSSATGWQAYYLSEPKVRPGSYLPPTRRLEPVGYFRRLRDAMQHVMVLHKLEQ